MTNTILSGVEEPGLTPLEERKIPAQSDIRDILGEMAAGPITSESKLIQVLRHFSAHNVPLKVCADNRHTGRKLSTLKRYACDLSLKFPDWVPRHMRPKKAKKAKAA